MSTRTPKSKTATPDKNADLEPFRERPEGTTMTSDNGIAIPETDNSLKAGVRGPSILEDFHFREKMTRFDHERIPERVVHARGAAAHGTFRVYDDSLARYTSAKFLTDPSRVTPVFLRFSTVAGSRGSADTARDVRGFAVKFYTQEGNFDLVGNNIPVFFIQDGIKFPDLIHAAKPEPHNEIPQAQTAHDTFWDFISLVPESAHMIMWVMSDRAIPRSYRMMEGFGVHTFRLVAEDGMATLVKFHWKPLLGVHSLVWNEALKIAGMDPDFHRRDLYDAIDSGAFPEWELGVQLISEADELKYGFDLLDATKLLPEEIVPVIRVGKLTLDRNPDNFFAETEQVAFHVANVVPGIDFTNDPLLQARLFSYLDTQLTRLGGPNFAQIPINRPLAPVHNHQQDGFHQQAVKTSRANYHPNTVGGGCPMLAGPTEGFRHYQEKVDGTKIRQRSESFSDHFTQARMFLDSMTPIERAHIVEACQFELGKCLRKEIRERVVALFEKIDRKFATEVAAGIGVTTPAPTEPVKADHAARKSPPSPALSMANTPKDSIATRKIAVLVADGFDDAALTTVRNALEKGGAVVHVIAKVLGPVTGASGAAVEPDMSQLTTQSVLYDAVFVPGGAASISALKTQGDAIHFVQEAYKHHKAIAVTGEGDDLLATCGVPTTADGIVTGAAKAVSTAFVSAIKAHRHWARDKDAMPA